MNANHGFYQRPFRPIKSAGDLAGHAPARLSGTNAEMNRKLNAFLEKRGLMTRIGKNKPKRVAQ